MLRVQPILEGEVRHIGDGVYLRNEGYGWSVMANHHEYPTDRIWLEPDVLYHMVAVMAASDQGVVTDCIELRMFDIWPRLLMQGFQMKEQDGKWWLFRNDGEGMVSGDSFRELCVNIVLAGNLVSEPRF